MEWDRGRFRYKLRYQFLCLFNILSMNDFINTPYFYTTISEIKTFINKFVYMQFFQKNWGMGKLILVTFALIIIFQLYDKCQFYLKLWVLIWPLCIYTFWTLVWFYPKMQVVVNTPRRWSWFLVFMISSIFVSFFSFSDMINLDGSTWNSVGLN